MAKEKNQPIGEIDCPRKGCTLVAKIFRYRRSEKQKGAPRFAGRLFCVCEAGHRCDDDQEYLLSHKAKIWSVNDPAPESVPAPAPVKPAPKPQAKPASKPATPQQPAAKPQPQPKVKKWGFW